MKKTLPFLIIILICAAQPQLFGQRYLTEVFDDVEVTSDVVYGENYTVLAGPPMMQQLALDFYEPAGDDLEERPLIIVVPTGSFGPRYLNNLPTGDKTDSATVEICTRFAKKGYTVAAIDHRKGWSPGAATEEARKQSIIRAVYRAMQDTKTAVRFFKKEAAENNNPFGVDVDRIVLGGQGSGGYVVLAYATLQEVSEIQLLKFYNFTEEAFMVDPDILGDFEGLGGSPSLNNDNHPGYTTEIKGIFNIGGALGDSTWQDMGEVPTISIHGVADAFAPYRTGTVFVPGTAFAVVEVSGSATVARQSNEFGNNDIFFNPPLTDPYTMRAQEALADVEGGFNDGDEGLFPIVGMANGNGPWEWWDEETVYQQAAQFGLTEGEIDQILDNGYATNPVYDALGPELGRLRALAYVDTIVEFVTPRLFRMMDISTSVDEIDVKTEIFPNPATDMVSIYAEGHRIDNIELYDIKGQRVLTTNVNSDRYNLKRGDLESGVYIVNLWFDGKRTTSKVVFK